MLTAVVLVLLVKTFAITSCTIPSTGMENSLYQGERVLVNKWSYGFRVPFSTGRWLTKLAGKGDVVLFNNPNPRSLQTAVGRRELFISRVIGIPGDTLMLNDELLVTGEQVLSPDSKSLYDYPYTEEEVMQDVMRRLNIQDNRLVGYADGKYIRTFSHYEYYLLKQSLAGKVDLAPVYREDMGKSHPFVIPAKGKPVNVYPWNVMLLCNTIVRHEGKLANVKGDTLYVGGKPVETYTFDKDYYWMASNNPVNLCDSRLFGLVPHDHLIGKTWRIWFSSRKERVFQQVQ
ncbi:MAG: signal peptidase I [Phocaeicola sp.]|uniref:signal peptidase I n=1 Tax=Phocaeicola sp. TaxID=2773926 RepID=UPI0023C8D834|nr:signal peptidase I [Phocaeicola sp.]MDE5677501.1 signal peptidase I [Phocaeicola sp.]MDE6179744.1 signal peptidase I [Phocaeicola sp.]